VNLRLNHKIDKIMQKKLLIGLLFLAVIAISTSSCKTNKCDCPKWELEALN